MAESQLKSLTVDYLTCTICVKVFTAPKMLKCGHSFCVKCLEGYVGAIAKRKDFFECPICREPYSISNMADIKASVFSLRDDVVTNSILRAIGIGTGTPTEHSPTSRHTRSSALEMLPNSSSGDEPYCACALNPERHLDTLCTKHAKVVCVKCAEENHSDLECVCTSARHVLNRRLNALKSLIAEQTKQVDRLFDSDTAGVTTVRTVFEDIQKCITDVEESFDDIYRTFKRRIESLRTKAKETIDHDLTCKEIHILQQDVVSNVKAFETENMLVDPNEILDTINTMCLDSSELQRHITKLGDKLSSGSLMKFVENDLGVLDNFVSDARRNFPDEFVATEDVNEEIAEIALEMIANKKTLDDELLSGSDADHNDMHVIFSAKCEGEDMCMLSGVALIGTTAAIIVDQKNQKIKKFKIPEGNLLHALMITHEPHQVATLRESSNVAVSLWDVPKILIVSTFPVMEVLSVINTDTEYIGLTSHAAKRLVAASIQDRRIDVISTEERKGKPGRKVETLYQSCQRRSFPDRLSSTSEGNVVVRNRHHNEISCFGQNNNLLWSRRLTHSVADIACFRGRLYATCNDRNAIVSIRDDGQGPVEIRYKHFVKPPWAIDGFNDCLIVTEDAPSDKVHLFVFA